MIRIDLPHEAFTERETRVAATGDTTVTAFRYRNGIEGLRIAMPRLEMVVLPYRGQQVWQAWVDGAPVGMQGMTEEPRAGATLLEAFGAFVYHCGLLGIGAPGPEDDHPLHGELPLAPIDEAWLEIAEDDGRTRLRVGGRWDFARAFRAHYRWLPSVGLVSGETTFTVEAKVENLMGSPLPFMYLAHPNFLPADGGEIAYSAHYGPGQVRVRTAVPPHLKVRDGYREQLLALEKDPSLHHRLSAELGFDPEIVFVIDYLAGEDGFAHSLQIRPDGSSDWIAHRPAECPVALRWISRTPEQDCIALAEPATSGLLGYTEERRQGRVPELAPGATWRTEIRLGRLDAEATQEIAARIERIAGRA
jgi:hypothetical protein